MCVIVEMKQEKQFIRCLNACMCTSISVPQIPVQHSTAQLYADDGVDIVTGSNNIIIHMLHSQKAITQVSIAAWQIVMMLMLVSMLKIPQMWLL